MTQSLISTALTKALQPSLLTERQTTCLWLASEGLSSRQIGHQLAISPRTVDDHIRFACQMLGVRTRLQAVAILAREGRRDKETRSFLP